MQAARPTPLCVCTGRSVGGNSQWGRYRHGETSAGNWPSINGGNDEAAIVHRGPSDQRSGAIADRIRAIACRTGVNRTKKKCQTYRRVVEDNGSIEWATRQYVDCSRTDQRETPGSQLRQPGTTAASAALVRRVVRQWRRYHWNDIRRKVAVESIDEQLRVADPDLIECDRQAGETLTQASRGSQQSDTQSLDALPAAVVQIHQMDRRGSRSIVTQPQLQLARGTITKS